MQLRWHVIKAVLKRNFLSYFSGVLGYVFIVAFVFLGAFFAFRPEFFANNLANLDQLNAVFPMLLLFFVPAITMGAWADERRQGTDELLFTIPASDLEILLGKYLAVLGVYTVGLLFSLSHVIVLCFLGSPDLGLMFTTYFGYWVTGAALLSAGMAASILSSSATVAYVLGVIFCAIPVFIDKVPVPGLVEAVFPFSMQRLFQGLSVSEQFRDFGLGMIPMGGLLYFISLTVLMLYLNLVLISRRHWAGGPHRTPMGLHYLARFAALGTILVSANAVAAGVTRRIDLTSEGLYSLSPSTSRVLRSLKPERPVLIQAFISPEVPREYVPTRTSLIGLLRQFDQVGGNNLRVRIVSTERYTDQADEAKRYGIEPQEIPSEREGRFVRDDVYLGVVITGSVDDQVVIPFFDKGTPVEYELTRSVRTVSEAQRKTVGLLRTDAQIGGGFDMQAFRPLPEWRIVTELKKQYNVKTVGPDELATGKYDVLLAVMPSSLTDPEMAQFVDYVKQGHPTMIVDDPFPLFSPGVAPKNPKPRPGGMGGMFGGGGGPSPPKADGGEARTLCDALGIAWNSGESVWDRTYDAHPEFRDLLIANQLYNVVYITPSNQARFAFNPDSNITQDLQEMMLFYPGQIKPRENSKLKFEPLLRASPGAVSYQWEEYVGSNMMGMGMTTLLDPPDKPARDATSPVIAAHITGKTGSGAAEDKEGAKAGGESEINVVFVADMDMISNTFFFIRDKEWQGIRLDNIAFVLNAVDALANDEEFLSLRARRPPHRTLSAVEKRTVAAKEAEARAASKADTEAKEALDAARKRLNDEVDAIRNDKSLDERTRSQKVRIAEENQRRVLEVEEANIKNKQKKEVKLIKDQTQREIKRVEDSIRSLAWFLPPIPALLVGLFVFSARARDEQRGVVPDRLVGKRS